MKFKFKCSFAVICGIALSSSSSSSHEIGDLIPPVTLTADHRDTLVISDLFYAEKYNPVFESNQHIDVTFNEKQGYLILQTVENFEGATLLQFRLQGREYAIPVISRIKQKHSFTFTPEAEPQQRMNIMGTFNDWNRNSLPMRDEDGDGVYEIELELDPGQYLYQFVIDDREIWDPENPVKVDNGFGSFNSVVLIPPRHDSRIFLHNMGFTETPDLLSLGFYFKHEGAEQLQEAGNVFVLLDDAALQGERFEVAGNQLTVSLPKVDLTGEHTLRVLLSQAGQAANIQTVYLRDGTAIGEDDTFRTWHDAIIYALMIDRFLDGDSSNSRPVQHPEILPKANYMGGDLRGVLQKIEQGYFDSLGVNALWISPVNDNPDQAYREWPPPHRYFSGYHGYWPIHHERVEERFGDLVLLKHVVESAHAHGIKVLLDFTANHVHELHPFFKEHRDWFGTYDLPDGRKNIRLWDEYRLTTWFEPFMPSFDYKGSDEALEVMTDNAIWWLQQTGADGFRHDAVKHIPNRFWRTLTGKVKQEIAIPESRKLYQIGETFGSYDLISSYVNNGQLDAQFNFNLYDVALYVFLNQDVSFDILDRELQKTFAVYGPNHLMGNVMDSHDKVRYMAYADGDIELNSSDAQEIGWHNPPEVDDPKSYDRAKLYLAYLLTIPGVPVIYYGDEIGMTGAGDPDNRRMMRFGEQLGDLDRDMLRDTRKMIKLRRNHSSLRYGDFQTVVADENVFAYLRSDVHERVLVVLNKSETSRSASIALPEFYNVAQATDLLSGQSLSVRDDQIDLTLPAVSFKMLKLVK